MKRSIKTLLAALVVSLCLVAPVLAGPFEDGLAAWERGEHLKALELWQPLEDQSRAALERGDNAIALRITRRLAELGIPSSQRTLGMMYEIGVGISKSDAEAVKWYRKAAESGLADAQKRLAHMHYSGRGVPQDYAKAVKWYRRAAEQGNAMAQYNLSLRYANGEGLPQDFTQAHKWANLAASRYSANETELRDKAVKNRETIAKKMTPAQIAEAQRLAREWKPKK